MLQRPLLRVGLVRPLTVGATRSHVPVTMATANQPLPFASSEMDASTLVDNLIRHTHFLMQGHDRHLVAFSGGVDSSLVLALLQRAASSNQHVQPVLGISSAVPLEQIQLARQVSSHLGFELREVTTAEGSDDMYIANEGQACLACKTHLYTCLKLVLDHTSQQQAQSRSSGALYNGTNADDTHDPTRVGLIAAANFSVLSPLEHTSKLNVRLAAKHLGLPNWNYAASPCLRSRLALGVEATQRHLNMIEEAERLVKKTLRGYNEMSNLRVRMLSSQRARVEVDEELMEDAIEQVSLWTPSFRELGFSSVNVMAFRSGSVSIPMKEPRHEIDSQ